MDQLLKQHGKYFGSLGIWACETCCKVGWTPQFNTQKEIEMHISKIHKNEKPNKFTLNEKICKMFDTIRECDKRFDTLINVDYDECIERIKYFIGNESNIEILENINFTKFIKQIENFYSDKFHSESLMEYEHTIEVSKDVVSGEYVAFITATREKCSSIDNEDSIIENTSHSEEEIQPIYSENESLKYEDEHFIDNDCNYDDEGMNLNDSNFENESLQKDDVLPTNMKNDEKLPNSWKNDFEFDDIKGDKIIDVEKGYLLEPAESHKLITNDNLKIVNATSSAEKDTFMFCDICDYKTTKTHYMEWHSESFHETIVFSCDQCDFTSQYESVLTEHRHAIHSDAHEEIGSQENKFNENENNELYKDFDMDSFIDVKTEELKSIDKVEDYHNGISEQSNLKKWDLEFEWDDSLILSNNEENFQYSEVIHYFNYTQNSVSLKDELSSAQENKKVSTNEINLKLNQQHEKIKKRRIAYTCNYCFKEFICNEHMERHIQVIHEGIFQNNLKYQYSKASKLKTTCFTERNLISCTKCIKQCKCKHNPKQHEETYHEKRIFSCNQCTFKTMKKNQLIEHVQLVHREHSFHWGSKNKKEIKLIKRRKMRRKKNNTKRKKENSRRKKENMKRKKKRRKKLENS